MKTTTFTRFLVILMFAGLLGPLSAMKHTINQQGFAFSPSVLNGVNLGDTVRWVWTSGFHTTTSSSIPSGATSWDAILSSGSTFFEYVPLVAGTYHYVCTPHASMGMIGNFTVNQPAGNSLSGYFYYSKAVPAGMAGCTIKLNNSLGDAIATATTDASGHYTFSGIVSGTYTIVAIPAAAPGGFNANDALQALKHFVNISALSGIYVEAADVDNSGFINAVDALAISRRFVGLISTFPAGDWYVQPVSLSLNGNTSFTQNIMAICYGDVDGSNSVLNPPSPQ